MKPRVLISVPNGKGWLHKHVAFALLRLQQDARVQQTIILPTHTPYVNNLHKIKEDFLNGPYDYWLTMDADNPPRRNVLDCVFLDKDIIGFPTPVWANMKEGDYPIYWNGLDAKGDGWTPHEPTTGLQMVDAVGSGCLLIARRVMAAMRYDHPFARVWNPDGTVEIGGDYSFCRKAKARGFEIYCHYGYPCHHFNEIEVSEIGTAFHAIQEVSHG